MAKQSKNKRSSQKVIRINEENYLRIKAMKGKRTFDTFITDFLDTLEKLQSADVCYEANGKLFQHAADARGQAILDSVASGTPATAPKMLLIMGEDDLDASI